MRDQPKKPDVSCRASMEDLYRYMDGYVDDDQRKQIQSHLNGCGGCGEVYDFHAVLHELVGRKCRTEMPEGLQQRVFRSILRFE